MRRSGILHPIGGGRCIGVWRGCGDLCRPLTTAGGGAGDCFCPISGPVPVMISEIAGTGAVGSASLARAAVGWSILSAVLRTASGAAVVSVVIHLRSVSLNNLPPRPIITIESTGIDQKRMLRIGRDDIMTDEFSIGALGRRTLKATRLFGELVAVRTSAVETFCGSCKRRDSSGSVSCAVCH